MEAYERTTIVTAALIMSALIVRALKTQKILAQRIILDFTKEMSWQIVCNWNSRPCATNFHTRIERKAFGYKIDTTC